MAINSISSWNGDQWMVRKKRIASQIKLAEVSSKQNGQTSNQSEAIITHQLSLWKAVKSIKITNKFIRRLVTIRTHKKRIGAEEWEENVVDKFIRFMSYSNDNGVVSAFEYIMIDSLVYM